MRMPFNVVNEIPEPEYISFKGWQRDISKTNSFEVYHLNCTHIFRQLKNTQVFH